MIFNVSILSGEEHSRLLFVIRLLKTLCLKDESLMRRKIAIVALRRSPYRVNAWIDYKRFNNKAKALAKNDPNIYYLNANKTVKDDKGAFRKDVYSYDRQHLNPLGYSLWGGEIKRLIVEMLDEVYA